MYSAVAARAGAALEGFLWRDGASSISSLRSICTLASGTSMLGVRRRGEDCNSSRTVEAVGRRAGVGDQQDRNREALHINMTD